MELLIAFCLLLVLLASTASDTKSDYRSYHLPTDPENRNPFLKENQPKEKVETM